jgi:hypothetical protein
MEQKKIAGRFMVPPPINRFDQWLLRHYPDIWSVRLHLVLWFALLVYSFLFLCYFFIPDDVRTNSSTGVWSFVSGIVGFIGLIFWLIYLLRFNVFKRFGVLKFGDRLRTFFLFFLTISIFVLFPVFPILMEKLKADAVFGDDEVVEDVNKMNLYLNQLEKGVIDVNFYPETLMIANDYLNMQNQNNNHPGARVTVNPNGHYSFEYLDSMSISFRLPYADSVRKLGDSGYVIEDLPDLQFVSAQRAAEHADIPVLKVKDLYAQVYTTGVTTSNKYAEQEFRKLFAKYYHRDNDYGGYDYYDYTYYDYDPMAGRDTYVEGKYKLNVVSRAIRNINNRKYSIGRDDEYIWIFHIIFYICLCFSLLIFAFRHSTPAAFFFALLTGFILFVITAIIFVFANLRERNVPLFAILYYMLFAAVSFTLYASNKRRTIHGIALNLFFLSTFFFPLACMGWYMMSMPYEENGITHYGAQYQLSRHEEEWYIFVSEFAGLALLILLILFVFGPLYRKWFSQPED